MEGKHRRIIQNNFSSLVEQTDLDLMVTTLYEKGVFSERMIECYKDTNIDVRTRKRNLYMDITRRGPNAFEQLRDSLLELGYWYLARILDPDCHLHPGQPIIQPIADAPEPALKEPPLHPVSEPSTDIPKFNVIKSTKFFEVKDSDLKLYCTRGRQRGVLLMFNYTKYNYDVDRERKGADVDCVNLKYLFSDIGFESIVYSNLSKKETLEKCKNLKKSLVGYECLFVVVSSHGYEKHKSSDTDFRCSDGGLISCRELIRQFNNTNLPKLKGIPKVFIFQICRGNMDDLEWSGGDVDVDADPDSGGGGEDHWPAPPEHDRAYSDILIAHSTLPGYVSHRDTERGSWYIQVLCEVVAAHAHESHVHTLLTRADEALRLRYPCQTSSVDSWGFNRRLYLHPGLYEETAPLL